MNRGHLAPRTVKGLPEAGVLARGNSIMSCGCVVVAAWLSSAPRAEPRVYMEQTTMNGAEGHRVRVSSARFSGVGSL